MNENENPKTTHGIDFLYFYMNPLVSGQLNNILISSKYKTEKYPISLTKRYKEFMEDLITTMECYCVSEIKNSVLSSFQLSSISDVGVLFWLNDKADSSDDLISEVATARIIDTKSTKHFIKTNLEERYLEIAKL